MKNESLDKALQYLTALLELSSKVVAMVGSTAKIIQAAHKENRDLTDAELAAIVSFDNEAKKALEKALGK